MPKLPAAVALALVLTAQHALAQRLLVSAANPSFDNTFAGPGVVEVVVADPLIADTTRQQDEPEITVNGKLLRMVQGDDGSWYGYFADRDLAVLADSTAPTVGSAAAGNGLDFGTFCGEASGTALGLGATGIGDTDGVAIPRDGGADGGTPGAPLGGAIGHDCPAVPTGPVSNNVVREPPNPSAFPNATSDAGQIGIDVAAWPFVQLYRLPVAGNVVIQYNPGGGVETVTLTYESDIDSYASGSLDRASYPQGADVHLTITDPWLNVDPTDEDSWTFASNPSDPDSFGTYYQLFDEDGNQAGDGVPGGAISLAMDLSELHCDDNCRVLLDPDANSAGVPVVTFQDNEKSEITASAPEDPTSFQTLSGQLPPGSFPITFTETGPNTGSFTASDQRGASNLTVPDDALRGTTATFSYNQDPVSILVRNFNGSIFVDLLEDWGGEEIAVIVNDDDLNENGLVVETLDLSDPAVDHVPSLAIGQPVTLERLVSAKLQPADVELFGTVPGAEDVESPSQRAFLRNATGSDLTVANGDEIVLDLGITLQELYAAVPEPGPAGAAGPDGFRGVGLLNLDVRSLFAAVDALESVTVALSDATDRVVVATAAPAQSLVDLAEQALDATPGFFDLDPLRDAHVVLTLNTPGTSSIPDRAVLPIVADFFSFGFTGAGEPSEPVANMIARLELVESGPNAGVFEGTLAFEMHNQLNVLDPQTYAGLAPSGDRVRLILGGGLIDAAGPTAEHVDVISEGVPVLRADRVDAPSHSVVLRGFRGAHDPGDTLFVRLIDPDLNVDSEVADVYDVVSTPDFDDPAFGAVGAAGLPDDLPSGPLGRLLDIAFDGVRWRTPQGSCDLGGVPVTGLDASGFALVETDVDSGAFEGILTIPSVWCRTDDGTPESTGGLTMSIRYVDFRSASNSIVQVSRTTVLPEPDAGPMGWTALLALGCWRRQRLAASSHRARIEVR